MDIVEALIKRKVDIDEFDLVIFLISEEPFYKSITSVIINGNNNY